MEPSAKFKALMTRFCKAASKRYPRFRFAIAK
jgi:hypothetical protein